MPTRLSSTDSLIIQTARRSLEDIDEIFLTEKFGHPTKTRKPAPKRPRGSIAAMEGGDTSDENQNMEEKKATLTEREDI